MARSKTTTTTATSTVKATRKSRAKKEVKVPTPTPVPVTVLPVHLRALVRVGELAFAASDATLPLAMKVGLHGSAFPSQWTTKKEGQALYFSVNREAYLANRQGWQRWLADVAGLAKSANLKAAFSPKGLKVSK